MTTRPAVLMHPPLPAFEARLPEYEVVHWPTDRQDIRAAIVLGISGIPIEALNALPDLGILACFGVGYEKIDVAYCAQRGIAVTHAQRTNHHDVAELAIGLMIAVMRSFTVGERMLRQGAWAPPNAIARPQRRLRGKKLGIVGFGAIGEAMAERADAFGLEVKWTGPRPKPGAAYPFEPDLIALADWADILAVAARGDAAASALSSPRCRPLQEHTMGWFSRADNGFFLATVFPDHDAARVAKYLGIVHGEAIIGANIFRDMFSSVRDIVGGRAGGYERALSGARDAAVEDLIAAARELGADGVVGIDFDYEVLGEKNGMMMVAVSGTAVKMA